VEGLADVADAELGGCRLHSPTDATCMPRGRP
jgi:hypothetical protein